MEKFKIKSVEPKVAKNGSKYAIVETYEGLRASCWDVGYISILTDGLNQDILLGTQEKNGYTSIVEVCPLEAGAVDQGTATGAMAEAPWNTPRPMSSSKAVVHKDVNKTPTTNESIVAQCIMKGAVELVKVRLKDTDSPEDVGKELAEHVNELTGAFKLALHNLQCGE